MVEETADMNAIRHIVGNKIIFPRLHFSGQSLRTIDDLRAMQQEALGILERKITSGEIKENGALAVAAALREFDWGNQSSYQRFVAVYDGYVGEVTRDLRELRDQLFKARE